MSGLVRAEWLRLRKRRDLWIVGLALLGLSIPAYFSGLANAQAVNAGGIPPDLPPDVIEQIRAQSLEQLAIYAFPMSIGTVVQNAQIILLALVAYLAAAVTGAEFGYGTIRTSLVAHADRRGFVVVRLMALALVAVLLIGLLAVLGILLPVLAAWTGTSLPQVVDSDSGRVAGWLGASLLATLLVIGLASLWVVLVRNAAIALVLTIAYVLIEGTMVGLIVRLAGEEALLRWLLPAADLQLLFDRARGSTSGAAMPTALAVAVGLGWVLVTWAASVWVLARSDIRE